MDDVDAELLHQVQRAVLDDARLEGEDPVVLEHRELGGARRSRRRQRERDGCDCGDADEA